MNERRNYWSEVLQAERNRYFLWIPVFFGWGISGYFLCPTEPSFVWVMGIGVSAVGVTFMGWRTRGAWLLPWIAVFIAMSGFTCMTLRTAFKNTFLPKHELLVHIDKGYIGSVVQRAHGWHLDLLIEECRPLTRPSKKNQGTLKKNNQLRAHFGQNRGFSKTPFAIDLDRLQLSKNICIRVYTKAEPDFAIGDTITGELRISPIPGPSFFGDFLMRRLAYYKGPNGYGSLIGPLNLRESLKGAPGGAFFSCQRHLVNTRLRESLPGLQSAIGAALITGSRYAIPQRVLDDFSVSGLSHVLAISGLHMSLIGALIFFITQSLLKRSRSVYVLVHGPKISSLVTVSISFMYLGLSGFGLSALRAFLMMGLVLLATIIHRPMLSLRTVAWAALAILVCFPESLINPSFSLSFAAVTGLIGGYESIKLPRFWKTETTRSWDLIVKRFFSKIVVYGVGIFASSCIATVSTLPFLLFYFHTFSLHGLVSNFIGIPLVAFWILPWGFIGTLLIPVGFHLYPYRLMGVGIEVLVYVIQGIAQVPGLTLAFPHPPTSFLIGSVMGGLWLIIWKKPWRFWGLIGPAIGIVLWSYHSYPTILITQDGSVIGVKEQGCLYATTLSQRASFDKKTSCSSDRLLALWKSSLGCTSIKPLQVCYEHKTKGPCYEVGRGAYHKNTITLVMRQSETSEKEVKVRLKLAGRKGSYDGAKRTGGRKKKTRNNKTLAFVVSKNGDLEHWVPPGWWVEKRPWD